MRHITSAMLFVLGCNPDKSTDTNSIDSAFDLDTAVDSDCPDDTTFFSETIYPILNDRCQGCHNISGVAGQTQMVISGDAALDQQMLTDLALVTDGTVVCSG